jgi:hypothetical protein
LEPDSVAKLPSVGSSIFTIMKYLLLALPLILLVACQDSGTDFGAKAGYVAGYQLTCGYSWKAGSKLVVEKEFARDFLDGAIICARKHPDRASRVLGLAKAKQPVLAMEADKPKEAAFKDAKQEKPVAAGAGEVRKQQLSRTPASVHKRPTKASEKTAKAPARPSKAPRKAGGASAKTKAAVNKTKAPKKTAKAPAKTAASPSKTTRGPPPAAKAKASVKTRESTVRSAKAPAPRSISPKPPVEDKRRKRSRHSSPKSDYERFMGGF